MNESRKRACLLLDEMLTPGPARRSKDLLPSQDNQPDYRQPPADWCDGWAFTLSPSFSRALDCVITERFKTENMLDENGKPIPDTDEQGVIKTTKTGKPIYIKIRRKFLEWTQGTAFCFRQGYTIHRADGGMLVQVEDAKEAAPEQNGIQRDAGFIRAQCYLSNPGPKIWKKGIVLSMTQDAFVRYLITGEHT